MKDYELQLPDGSVIDIEGGEEFKTGDIRYTLETPWRVLLQRTNKFDKVEYMIHVSIEDTEKLKDKYPDKEKHLKSTDNLKVFEIDEMTDRFLENKTIVFTLWHKGVANLAKGRKLYLLKILY